MSDSESNPLNDLLSSFALGPSWARATGGGKPERTAKEYEKSDGRPPRRDQERTGARTRDSYRDDSRPQKGRGGKFNDSRNEAPRNEEVHPAHGVQVSLIPDPAAVHLIGKEIHQVARVYPLLDVAQILLAERGRCRAVFEAPEPHPPLFRGKLDDSLFHTREDAMRHLWQSGLKGNFIEEETIEVDPPTGNFQLVAKCGVSGEWLGPPNFHTYQSNLRRIHRERFPNMPFAAYSARVRTERGEEAVNAWLATMIRKTHWRIKSEGDEPWIEDEGDAHRALASRCFDQAFETTRRTELLASVPPANLSASLMVSLKFAGNHARQHPAYLIPAVCKALEAEHLPIFKRQGKLFTGPARPHPLPLGQALAQRPSIMVEWIRANKPAKLEGLWKAVLPEGGTAPPAEFAADLFWLLHQGHILLFIDDTLVVQEVRDPNAANQEERPPAAKKKNRKPKNNKNRAAEDSTATPPQENTLSEASALQPPIVEGPVVQSPVIEAPVVEAPVIEAPEIKTHTEFDENPDVGVDGPTSL